MGYQVGIVGGGASGMMAAIAAAEEGASVTLLEGNDRLGRKILATGNGKCNLGNEKLDPGEYYAGSPEFLESCLKRFGTEETMAFFRESGLLVKSRNGYLYPMSEQASSVLDVLRYKLRRLGVGVITECKIEHIEIPRINLYPASPYRQGSMWNGSENTRTSSQTPGRRGGQGKVRQREKGERWESKRIRVSGSGKEYDFDRLILACGGCAAPRTGSDGSGYRLAKELGHTLVPTVPALVQLKCRGDSWKSVAGVRAEASMRVLSDGRCVAKERGELQLTDYGLSGIPVFQVSRVVNYILFQGGRPEVEIDLLPDISEEAFLCLQNERSQLKKGCTAEEFFTGLLNKKLMLLFIRLAGLKASEDAAKADPEKIRQVYRLCRQWRIQVTGSNPYDNAQVSAGGIPLSEVTESLESRKAAGVYFAGEILDVDGKCGGYNLQWAWCSGYLAGKAAAGRPVPVGK